MDEATTTAAALPMPHVGRLRWDTLPPASRAILMRKLRVFVQLLDETYLRQSRYELKKCWWRHPDVVWQLTALMDSFDAVYAEQEPSPSASAWHIQHLWPTLDRIADGGPMRNCNVREHRPETQPPIPVDDALDSVIDTWISGGEVFLQEISRPDDQST